MNLRMILLIPVQPNLSGQITTAEANEFSKYVFWANQLSSKYIPFKYYNNIFLVYSVSISLRQ